MKIFICAIFLIACSAMAQTTPDTPLSAEEFKALQKKLTREHLDEMYKEKVLSRKSGFKKSKNKPQEKPLGAQYEQRITDTEYGEESEIHAAVNPADSNNIVISAIKTGGFGFTLPVYYTKDFGKSWKRSSFAPTSEGGGDPVFTYDADGTLYFSWIDVQQGGEFLYNAILFSVSKNGGATWSQPDTIFSDRFNFSSGAGKFGDKQWMAVDKSNSSRRNTVYTALVEFSGVSSQIVVRRKKAADKKFLKISAPISKFDFLEVQFPSIEVDDNGRVHVFFWGSKTTGMRSYLWHSVSENGAESFSEPKMIAPVRFPARSGNLPSFLPQRFAAFPQFALDRHPQSPNKGNMYAIWCSNDLNVNQVSTYEQPFHIYFIYSGDNGTTWSAPRRLNNDTATDFRADHYHPSIDITPKGDVITTWYDGRKSDFNSEVNYFTSFSFDGGKTFPRNIQVSDQSSDINMQGDFGIGDYTKTLSSSGYAIPIWADGRENDGNIRIYAAFVPLEDGSINGVIERKVDITSNTELYALYPNPAQNTTSVRFRVGTNAGLVEMDIIDVQGKVLKNVFKKTFQSGERTEPINCEELSIGKYFIRLKTVNSVLTQPLNIVR